MASRVIDVTMQLIDKITEPLSGINSKLKDSGRQWQNAGKDIMKTGQSITKAGQTLTTGLTMPIVGAGIGAVKTAANFEAGMSKVQAISGASEEAMGQLTNKAMEMGAKTKFSATEASDAFSYMAMAGWKTEQMMSGIEGVMYLAGATGEDLAQTSDIVTDAMTAFGMAADETSTVIKDGVATEVSNVTRFVDVLAATANNANTNVGMLGESFKYVASVAGSMGYSIEDISVALGTMANSGIKASQGGTALRTLLTNMANPSEKMATAMETLGVSLDDGAGNMKSFAEVMQDLRAGFGELKMSQEEISAAMDYWNGLLESGQATEDEYNEGMQALMENALGAEGAMKAQAAAMLAGKTGMAGLLAIVNSSDEDFNSLTQAINNSNGACEQMYSVTQDNLLGRLTILKSTIESIAIAFGNELSPYVEKATKFIQGLADKFNSLDSAQRQQIIKIAAIVAAVGPALLIIGKLTTGVGAVVTKVGQFASRVARTGSVLAALASPGAIVVASIVAIGVAIALVVTHWDQIKEASQAAFEVITRVAGQIKDAVVSKLAECGVTLDFFKEKLEPIKQKWQELAEKVMNVWTAYIHPAINWIIDALSSLWAFLSPILQKIGELFIEVFKVKLHFAINTGIQVFKLMVTAISTAIETLIGFFSGLIDFIVGVFTGNWQLAWEGVVSMFTSVFDGIKGIAEGVFDFILGLVNGVISAVSTLISLFSEAKSQGSGIQSPGHNASGTTSWKGGPTWVHERGPEIIDLPKGTRIYPHSESLKMAYNEGRAQGGGRSGGSISINIPKLADSITVRSDGDIEAIAAAIANRLEQTAQNLGGEELGYIY